MYKEHGRFLRQLVERTWPDQGWSGAGRALSVDRGTLRLLHRRRKPPTITLALRLRDVLGFPLSYWVNGVPEDARPEHFGPLTSKDLEPREWDDRPPSFEPHARLLREMIEDHALTLEQARRRLGAGSRSGLRHVLVGEQAPNARIGYLAWIELGFDYDWWRWTVPGERRRAA
jgi:transcriptional regulator with XRE-family HTH domain